MPIYLCQPGTSSSEPWRHGIQVYERPFPLFQQDYNKNASSATNKNKKEESRREGPEQVVVVVNPSSSSSGDHDQQASLDEKLAALKRYLTEYIVNPDSTTTTRSSGNTGYTKHRAIIFCSNGTSLKIVRELTRQPNGLATLQSKNTVLALDSADNTNVYNKIDEFKMNRSPTNRVGGGSCNILVVEEDSGKYKFHIISPICVQN